jgi:ABC-type branched-subunit amino acid transport system substrate-binding protein
VSRSGAANPNVSFQLRIANVLPFTGDLSTFGPSLDAAVKVAVDRINAALEKDGLSKSISVELVGSEDDESRAQAGVEAATKLVKADRAQVIIGSMASSATIPIAQSVTIPNHVVLISPTSSAPQITFLKDSNYVWRTIGSDNLQGPALSIAVADAFGKNATVNVGSRNDAFGTALKAVFIAHWKKNGGKIGADVSWNPNEPRFDNEAAKLTAGDPSGWVIIDFPETFARLGPALVRTGKWSPKRTFMTDAMANATLLQKIGDQATLGLRGTSPTSQAAGAKPTKAFTALFKTKAKGKSVTGFEGTSFDSAMLAFLAALRAHSSDPAKIRNNLRAVSGPPGRPVTWLQLQLAIRLVLAGTDINYEGVWGPIDFDEHGDPSSALFKLWQYKDGVVSTLKTFAFRT